MAFTKIVGAGIQTTTDVTVRNVQAGIITATKFIGDISEATGAAAGLGTALSQDQSNSLNKIYYTNQVLSIGSTVTVDPPDSSNIAYTQYAEIAVEEGYDLIVEDGDDLIPDILGLSTETATPLSGAGGRIRADLFTNKAGTGAPTFSNGINVTGVGTALLVTGDARITGILTIGTSSVTLDGTNNQVNVGTGVTIHHTNGVQVGGNTVHSEGLTVNQINASGIITASSFSGNLVGNVTGNVTGDVNASVVTASSSIVVGDKFIGSSGVGLGTTTTVGRNTGINTATGTMIYNVDAQNIQIYKGPNIGWSDIAKFILVSGGTVSDTRPGYKVHTFTADGNFITDGTLSNVELLVVGGGAGGGGNKYGGGGGAGGVSYATGLSITAGTHLADIGPGGSGGADGGNAGGQGGDGTLSQFGPGAPSPFYRLATGGGGGGSGYTPSANGPGRPGGSGGGCGSPGSNATGGSATQPSQNPGKPGTNSGNAGGSYNAGYSGYAPTGGGGAGAAGVGNLGAITGGGNGGDGIAYSINGTSTRYGAGGGASLYSSPPYPSTAVGRGGNGGGGNGAVAQNNTLGSSPGINGVANTGSGGGGAHGLGPSVPLNNSTSTGGAGGSGIIIVAYPTADNFVNASPG